MISGANFTQIYSQNLYFGRHYWNPYLKQNLIQIRNQHLQKL